MMKKFMLSICLFCACTTLQAQGRKHTTFFDQRATLFEVLPTSKKDIIFLGNSITNGGEWAELFGNPHVKNRGISGDGTDGILDRLHVITKGKPAKIFLLIGINDLSGGRSIEEIAKNIDEIAERIKKESPSTRLYLQSVLPMTTKYNKFVEHTNHNKDVPALNALIKDIANRRGLTYIDLFSEFVIPGTQEMNPDYTNDGLHLLGKGYLNWIRILKPYLGKQKRKNQNPLYI